MNRKPIVAVVGGSTVSEKLMGAAELIGWELVNAGYRVATGGLGGVMTAASGGARKADGWSDGDVIGVLPGLRADDANEFVDIAIPTGMNTARNVVLVNMADVVIAVGGGAGTLSEIALAWQHGKAIIALDMGEGWSAKLAGHRIDNMRVGKILRAPNPAVAVQLVGKALAQTRMD